MMPAQGEETGGRRPGSGAPGREQSSNDRAHRLPEQPGGATLEAVFLQLISATEGQW